MPKPKRPRDSNGWAIPHRSTLSWHIYQRLLKGWPPIRIARSLDHDPNSIRVLIWGIKHPEDHHARQTKWLEQNKFHTEAQA